MTYFFVFGDIHLDENKAVDHSFYRQAIFFVNNIQGKITKW